MNWEEHHNYGEVGYSLGCFDLIVWISETITLYEEHNEIIGFGKISIEEAKEKAFDYIIDKLSNQELRELQKET
jgi:lysylphosphatidylglycerol synthetase-like protein (DUF2156 family)